MYSKQEDYEKQLLVEMHSNHADLVNELREKKKAKLLRGKKRKVFDEIPTGLLLKDEKTEDFIIFTLAFLIVYLFFHFFHVI